MAPKPSRSKSTTSKTKSTDPKVPHWNTDWPGYCAHFKVEYLNPKIHSLPETKKASDLLSVDDLLRSETSNTWAAVAFGQLKAGLKFPLYNPNNTFIVDLLAEINMSPFQLTGNAIRVMNEWSLRRERKTNYPSLANLEAHKPEEFTVKKFLEQYSVASCNRKTDPWAIRFAPKPATDLLLADVEITSTKDKPSVRHSSEGDFSNLPCLVDGPWLLGWEDDNKTKIRESFLPEHAHLAKHTFWNVVWPDADKYAKDENGKFLRTEDKGYVKLSADAAAGTKRGREDTTVADASQRPKKSRPSPAEVAKQLRQLAAENLPPPSTPSSPVKDTAPIQENPEIVGDHSIKDNSSMLVDQSRVDDSSVLAEQSAKNGSTNPPAIENIEDMHLDSETYPKNNDHLDMDLDQLNISGGQDASEPSSSSKNPQIPSVQHTSFASAFEPHLAGLAVLDRLPRHPLVPQPAKGPGCLQVTAPNMLAEAFDKLSVANDCTDHEYYETLAQYSRPGFVHHPKFHTAAEVIPYQEHFNLFNMHFHHCLSVGSLLEGLGRENINLRTQISQLKHDAVVRGQEVDRLKKEARDRSLTVTTQQATIQRLKNEADQNQEVIKGCHELETKVQDLSDQLKEHQLCPSKIDELSEKLKEHDSCAGQLADLNKRLLDHASCAGKIQELESARDSIQIELAEAKDDVQYWEERHKNDVISAAFIGAQDFAYKFLPQHNMEIPSAYRRLTPELLVEQEKTSAKGKEVLIAEENEEENEEEDEEENYESEEEGSEEEAGGENPKGQDLSLVIFAGNVGGKTSEMATVNASQPVAEQSTKVVIDVDELDTRNLGEASTVETVRNDCHPDDSGTGDIGADLLGDQDKPPTPKSPFPDPRC